MSRESDIERYLHDRVERLGGEYRRVAWIGRRHANDDFILLPGRHLLVECKRPGKKATPGQAREHDRLRKAGLEVHVVSTEAEIDAILPLVVAYCDSCGGVGTVGQGSMCPVCNGSGKKAAP